MNRYVLHRWFGFMLLLVLISSCGGKGDGQSAAPAGQAPALVDVLVTAPEVFVSRVTAIADLLPFEQVDVVAPVEGTVMEIHFEEGQKVRRGQLLVTIDDRTLKAQWQGLKAQLAQASNELARKEVLYKAEGASAEQVEQARAEYDRLMAQVEEIEVRISLCHVEAPFDGVVGMRDFSRGAFLSRGALITRLVQGGKLKVDFDVPSQYAASFHKGMNVDVISGKDSTRAAIIAVEPAVDASSRTLRIRAAINEIPEGWLPGMYAEVSAPVEAGNLAIAVPTDAVIPELNSQVVYIVEQGRSVKRPVKLGSRNRTDVHILEGLETGDTVITSGLLQLKNDGPVKINRVIGK